MADETPRKPRTVEDVLRDMIGGQAVMIARLTAIVETTVPALRAELDAALKELAALKAAGDPPKE